MPQRRTSAFLDRNILPIFVLLLTLGVAAAYRNAWQVPFIFDDITAIPRNETLGSFGAALHPPVDTTVSGRPLLNLSFGLNRALGGDRLPGYHLGNLAVLWASALFLFGLVRRILNRLGQEWQESSGPLAALIALIWACHPLQTESVTYLVQRAESLMGFCYLGLLYCVTRCASPQASPRSAIPWGIFAVAACWLGMATKEVMVSAPLIAVALDRTCFAGSWREACRRRWPMYLAMAASWLLLAGLVASTHGRNGTAGFAAKFSELRFLRTEIYAVLRYLRLSFWPGGQILDYGSYWVDSPSDWIPAAALVAALAIFVTRSFWRGSIWGWLGAWFFAVLAPTCLIPVPRQTLAEHRMYLALAPVVIVSVAGLWKGMGKWAFGGLAAVALGLGIATEHRNRAYVTERSIWLDTVAKLPTNPYAQNNVGSSLLGDGLYPPAEPYLRKAVALNPDFPDAWINLGVVLGSTGRRPEAESAFQRALSLNPASSAAHNDYGNLLRDLGRTGEARQQIEAALRFAPNYAEARSDYGNVLVDLNQFGAAEEQYRLALRLNPQFALAHNGLGIALLRQKRPDEARLEFAEARRCDSRLATAYANDGEALVLLGRLDEANGAYTAAEARDPTSAEIRYNHGLIRYNAGDYVAAAELFAEAVKLNPAFSMAHYNLAVALYRAKRFDESLQQFGVTIQLDPTNADAHNNYGAVLLQLNRPAEALKEFEEVARLDPHCAGLSGNLAAARQLLSRR